MEYCWLLCGLVFLLLNFLIDKFPQYVNYTALRIFSFWTNTYYKLVVYLIALPKILAGYSLVIIIGS